MMTYPTSAGTLPGTLDVHMKCVSPNCRTERTITVSEQGLAMLRAGEDLCRALPDIFPSDRELLVSGTCGACWNELWAIWVGLGQELEPMQEAL